MKIVAFLQCLWLKNPEQGKLMLEDAERKGWREKLLKKLLFFGGKTGAILSLGLGDELCNAIIWEESTKQIAGKSSGVFPLDLEHMKNVLNKHQPNIVVVFGKVAENAIENLRKTVVVNARVICCPHPASRGFNALPRLKEIRKELDNEN